ncbi:DUF2752 domain-containing protein [Edaphobacter bradus]|uniref:DUF2752 domain-containing protein n=1 Tax=Edaphobacter bradus TaxID=2259016 RepID=UPI0021E06824|nr:DUF2752 domain-containing protein [Edaphobacter bradus]
MPFTIAAAMLLCFPPAQSRFYPRCPIYALLHLQCPGCGATRTLAALLHGHLTEALRLNALFTLALPILAAWLALAYLRFLQRRPFRLPQPPQPAVYATLAIAALFTILRNL